MLTESPKCQLIREFLATNDHTLLEETDLLRSLKNEISLNLKSLKNRTKENLEEDKNDIIEYWNVAWGEIVIRGCKLLYWKRPDCGPDIHDRRETVNHKEKIFRFALQAILIKELETTGLLSFVTINHPKDKWRKCKVYLNEKELDKVVSACAITGIVEISDIDSFKKGNEEVPLKRLTGHVIIDASGPDRGFF